MKKIITYGFIITLSFCSIRTFSQNIQSQSDEQGGEFSLGRNDAAHPCMTSEQYKVLEQQISDNIKLFKLNNGQPKTAMTTLFNWPLKTNGLNDCSYYYIGNYLDQDPTAGFKDWNCGSVTYDGHAGTDICLCPYPFYKMDNNQVEVIAAAAGTISAKIDGNFDKNCASNTLTPNYMAVMHPDGSNSIYLHLKKNSLTAKNIGQTVAAGEFLANVGSSGSSSGPHLHFEVWSGNTSATLKDAWYGSCNVLNASTWWAAQKPYTEPAIIKAQVNNVAPVLPACPTTETSNEDSCFIAGASARFYIFIRNETNGMVANQRIINPGGTTFTSWTHNSNTNYLAAYWFAVKTLPTVAGTYTFETIYNGITCSKTFSISCGSGAGIQNLNNLSQLNVSPNPANSILNITAQGVENGNYSFALKNITGQTVLEENNKIENNSVQKIISISELPNGVYFLIVKSDKSTLVKKIIKQN